MVDVYFMILTVRIMTVTDSVSDRLLDFHKILPLVAICRQIIKVLLLK